MQTEKRQGWEHQEVDKPNRGLGWTFDTVSKQYEKLRPGYPQELYEDVFRYGAIGPGSRAVEVGIGGGQATLPVLQTGCQVTAVEYGENFTRLCREKFREFPGFAAVTAKFEDFTAESGSMDLIYSASAFHWVPEEVGYPKVFDLLKKGGVFARFANHPFRDKGKPELSEAIDQAYAKYYYPFYKKEPTKLQEYSGEQAQKRAEIAGKYGFTDIVWKLYTRTRTFSAQEYQALLGTYSDHIAMDEPVRTAFYAAIGEAINRFGGEITIYDTIDLQLARKP